MAIPARTTLWLSRDLRHILEKMLRERPQLYSSASDVIRNSILLADFLIEQVKSGKKILIFDPKQNSTQELDFSSLKSSDDTRIS